jgi:carbonic anhydrase
MFKSFAPLALLATVGHAASDWGYTQAGADWSSIAGYELCASEVRQSPINLPVDGKGDNFKQSVEMESMMWKQEWNKVSSNYLTPQGDSSAYHTYQLPSDGGSMSISADSGVSWDSYTWNQVHMHAPSEHRFEGEQRDLEVHFVHTHSDGTKYGVLAVTFNAVETDANGDAQTDNAFLALLLKESTDPYTFNSKTTVSY